MFANELGVEFEADEEEEEDDAELGKDLKEWPSFFWEELVVGVREDPAEEAGAEHDACDHFADDLGLTESGDHESDDAAECDDEGDLEEEEADVHAVGLSISKVGRARRRAGGGARALVLVFGGFPGVCSRRANLGSPCYTWA